MWIRMIFGSSILLEFNYEELFTNVCGCQEGLDGTSRIEEGLRLA